MSDDTILRLLKLQASERGATTTVRVAGIDDWSWRKGRTYGIIVVDLERRQVVDVLPEADDDKVRSPLSPASLSTGGDQRGGLAVFSVSAQPAHGRGDAGGARYRREPRNGETLGREIWAGLRQPASPSRDPAGRHVLHVRTRPGMRIKTATQEFAAIENAIRQIVPEKDLDSFVQNYHERDAAHCPELGTLPNRELTAVLDGQQRLTALNIGLRGSMALKEPNKWRTNPNAFPKKLLHLDLLAARGEDEEGEAYSFRFLESEKAAADQAALWYPAADILSVPNISKLSQWLYGQFQSRQLGTSDGELFNRASDTLHRLYEVVHTVPNLIFYTEKSQELDRVLRIFIRMNAGGRCYHIRTCS